MTKFTSEKIIDQRSASKLFEIVKDAAHEMSGLGSEPIIVYGDTNRFNGSEFDDYWAGAQFEVDSSARPRSSYWYAVHFFDQNDNQSKIERLKSQKFARIEETIEVFHDLADKEVVQAAVDDPDVGKLQQIISALEQSDWRELSESAFSSNGFPALGVYLFREGVWFIRGVSSRGEAMSSDLSHGLYRGEIWHLTDEKTFLHFGHVALPKNPSIWGPSTIIGMPPIDFEDINKDAANKLSQSAKNWFLPAKSTSSDPEREKAHKQISSLFAELALEIREITSKPVTYLYGRRNDHFSDACREIHFEDEIFRARYSNYYTSDQNKTQDKSDISKTRRDIVGKIGTVLNSTFQEKQGKINERNWRQVFSAAFLTSVHHYDQLYLKITNDELVFTRGFSVFRLVDGILVPDGLLGTQEIERLYLSIGCDD